MATLEISNLPERLNLKVSQGATLGLLTFTLFNPAPPDGDGLAVDLTGSTIRAKVRKTFLSGTVTATFVIVILNQTTNRGSWTAELTDETTAAITAGEKITDKASRYVWDMELEDSLGRVTTLYRGEFNVESEATR